MARRSRRSAWGSVLEVAPGVWRIRYWAAGPDGYRRRSVTVRGTRIQAEQRRSELMLAHAEDAPCPAVGEVWRAYAMPDMERRVNDGDMSRTTVSQYAGIWRNHAEPRWGSVPCDAVRALEVQQWLYGMPLVAARSSLMLMRVVLDYAVRYEFVAHNVAREKYVMPARSTREERDKGVWDLGELGEIWHRQVRGEWFEPAFLLAAFGGLRVGECLGVRSEDVSEVHGCAVVEVRRQVTHSGGVSERLKTPQSRRPVAIPGRAGECLLLRSVTCGGWLTGDGLGGFSTQRRLRDAWGRLGMEHPFRNLRNSWQTNMRWGLRLPPWLIEPMMGHRVEGVTGMHYDRPRADMFAEIVADAYRERPFDAGWTWLD